MGLSFRKSIKIGKNTRINLSKTGGIGISTGVKGARVSVNQNGVRTTVGTGGIQYRKDHSFKKGNTRVAKQEASTGNAFIDLIKGIFGLVFWGGLFYLIVKFLMFMFSS
ncbi:DUF4236 domain-containing protein [Clostridium sp. DJ247]|uniref:DUF4236 domain-containing protein n=1 Tax=Clostridium sp. DJ247 TaxID=2726188 RepID=UPI00162A4D2B|nr:DUF4236 domain-containing protein [Clostridium sp. DJ247]MBC2579980.1 DUF4236 domain-containing protein [Clostridium sp. DJ247]